MNNYLECNYQKLTTNRFVVDSERFWRKEFHPRFSDIINQNEIKTVFENVNDNLSFKVNNVILDLICKYFWDWLAGYRANFIPQKNIRSKDQFLASLYFALLDLFMLFSYTDFPLIDDDFNIVTHRAETSKSDSTKLATNENNESSKSDTSKLSSIENTESSKTDNSKVSTDEHTESSKVDNSKVNTLENLKDSNSNRTNLNVTTNTNQAIQNIENSEVVDDYRNKNVKSASDVFLSPQNQGVLPISENLKYQGTEGLNLSANASFTTNTNNQNLGESEYTNTNNSNLTQQSDNAVVENNEVLNENLIAGEKFNEYGQESNTQKSDLMAQNQAQENLTTKNDKIEINDIIENINVKNDKLAQNQEQENLTQKGDLYEETLKYDRIYMLQRFFNLKNNNRIWLEFLNRMSYWILQMDIATSEQNYNNITRYE